MFISEVQKNALAATFLYRWMTDSDRLRLFAVSKQLIFYEFCCVYLIRFRLSNGNKINTRQ